jgi:hypothetical protein
MATQVLDRLGDLILAEMPGRQSRRSLTVASGTVLRMGQVARLNLETGKVTAPTVASGVNEQHTLDCGPNPTGGTYRLKLWHKDGYWVWTQSIAEAASAGSDDTTAGTIRYAIAQALGSGGNTVSGDVSSSITITWAGTGYAGKSWPVGTINVSKLTATLPFTVTGVVTSATSELQNETQIVTISGPPSAGNYFIEIPLPNSGFNRSDAIAYDAVAATIQTALIEAAGGVAQSLIVSASTDPPVGLPFKIVFSGLNAGYRNKPWPAVRVISTGLTGGGAITVTRERLVNCICLRDVDATAALFLAYAFVQVGWPALRFRLQVKTAHNV